MMNQNNNQQLMNQNNNQQLMNKKSKNLKSQDISFIAKMKLSKKGFILIND